MNPENPQTPQPTPPTQPTPAPFQPTQTGAPIQSTPPVTPAQPVAFPQPAATAQVTNGMKPPTSANIAKQQKFALIASIASIAIFIVGLLLGYVFAAAALLGAYAIAIGIRSNPKPKLTITLGAIGLILNFGLYTLSLFAK